MPERRELYRSPNGDCWFLGREPQDGRAFVLHQANGPSGAHLSHIELGAFLNAETKGPDSGAFSRADRNCSRRSEQNRDHLREEALRARWWAVSITDPVDRERIEAVAREYEKMAQAAERAPED